MARKTKYTVEQFVPDGKGGWRNLKDLSPEEYKIFCDKLTEGLLAPQAEFFKKRPEFFEKCCKEGLVTDIEYRTDKNTVEEEKNALTKTKK